MLLRHRWKGVFTERCTVHVTLLLVWRTRMKQIRINKWWKILRNSLFLLCWKLHSPYVYIISCHNCSGMRVHRICQENWGEGVNPTICCTLLLKIEIKPTHIANIISLVVLYRFRYWPNILWRICSIQELLSHRGLGARTQRESCGLYRRVARRQLCERLDCATGNASDLTYPTHPVTTQRSINTPTPEVS
jgi:hypothetical protein